MSVLSYCEDRQGWFPKEDVQRRKAQKRFAEISHARADFPCPQIISDNFEMKSMLDGKIYTSKRAYERSVRAGGCEIVGNENPAAHTAPTYDEKTHVADIAADVKQAIEEVSSR